VPVSVIFTLSTSPFSSGVHLWIDSMGRKKGENPIKEPLLPPFLSLSQVLAEFYSRLLHHGLWQQQEKLGKLGKGQLQLPGLGAGKAYQHGQYRLVHNTSTGVLPFYALAGVVCRHPHVGPILFAGSLFCFLHRTTESKPSHSTISTVCLRKQTVIITKY